MRLRGCAFAREERATCSLLRRVWADAAALFDAVFICIDCVKQGRRLPENGRVPRTKNQFFRGPWQATFASASIGNSLLRGPRGQDSANRQNSAPLYRLPPHRAGIPVPDLSKRMVSRPWYRDSAPWGRAFAVFLV